MKSGQTDYICLPNILLWIFDHEILSMVILSLPLIQEEQFKG